MKIETRTVHQSQGKRGNAELTIPISATSTYRFADTQEIVDYFEHRRERFEYGRYGNPTVAAAERVIASLDGGERCAIFSSGMAAITTTLLAMVRSGQHVVMTADCYRRTRQFSRQWLAKFGVEVTLVPAGDTRAIEEAIIPGKTRILFAESPTNPYLRVPTSQSSLASHENIGSSSSSTRRSRHP